MNCQAGVDEAGLGPILGPLVVTGIAMTGPGGSDPWRALRRLVCRDRAEKGKLRVADSKKVKQGERGLEKLEQTVLAFWAAKHGDLPGTVASLLEALEVDLQPLRNCPWYRDMEVALPLAGGADALELRGHSLGRAMARAGLSIEHWTATAVDAAEYNASIAATDNKSRTHFEAYGAVLQRLLRAVPAGTHVVADRCGGIQHYGPALHRALGRVPLLTLEESPGQSRYEVGRAERRVRLTFAVQGEDRSFPTALASCTAKYVRELLMHLLNRWFAARLPGLAPTAGYYTDGHRFLVDIEPLLRDAGFPRELLVRCR